MIDLYENCRLCPRLCGVNRKNSAGRCGEADIPRISWVGAHHGEEPPISGSKGSCTVFFSGCSLACIYCQNYQISSGEIGDKTDIESLFGLISNTLDTEGAHNVNFVSPDHFFPHVFMLAKLFRDKRPSLPLIYNTSGYQRVSMLKMAEPFSDIYLPDYKYSDSFLAGKYSNAPDYPTTALEALSEMILQKGFLNSFETQADIATKGVLVRHLILPGAVQNSIDALTTLFLEFGKNLPLSLMSQYHPVSGLEPPIDRIITSEEFYEVYCHAMELGFKNIFAQFPEDNSHEFYNPDFREKTPFSI